jgi:hypothetical protein
MGPAVSNLWLQHSALFYSPNSQGFFIASVLLAENPYNSEYIKNMTGCTFKP